MNRVFKTAATYEAEIRQRLAEMSAMLTAWMDKFRDKQDELEQNQNYDILPVVCAAIRDLKKVQTLTRKKSYRRFSKQAMIPNDIFWYLNKQKREIQTLLDALESYVEGHIEKHGPLQLDGRNSKINFEKWFQRFTNDTDVIIMTIENQE